MKRVLVVLGAVLLGSGAVPAAAAASPQVLLEAPGMRLVLEDGRIRVFGPTDLVVDVRSVEFNFQAPMSLAAGERAADRTVLKAVYPADADYAGGRADLPVDIVVERVAGGFHFTAKPDWARNVTVRLSDLDDHFFGVLERLYPNNRPGPDLRGTVVDVDAIGDGSQYHENYASAWSAFYMTARGCASFFDTFARGRYRLGIGGETELYHQTGALDWYVFLGRDGDELLASYYRVAGAPKAPPLWALGPIGWRDQNDGGADEILSDVRHMTQLRIPFTGWFVDRPYSDGAHEWSKMNFSAKFATPASWIGTLEKDFGLRFMTWIAPMTFGDPDFPGLLAGETGYMDLSDPAAVAEFGRRLALQYTAGVHGHKDDRADEGFPAATGWKDGTPEPERRNRYLYLYAKVTHDALTRAWGPDHVNFARGAFQRTQPYLSAIWGGDSRSSWDGLAGNLGNAIRAGFLGFPVWGSDTGGYLGGRIDEELFARWLEWSAWSGLFEVKLDNMGGRPDDRPPWVYGEALQASFRDACELRMRLLPYVFSLAHTAGRTGVLMKPLAYVWPGDPATHAIADEDPFGPAFLVAPLTKPGGQRSVYLPEGRWRDFHDPARVFEGRQTIAVTAPFDRIPVFVRDNSIYVTGTVPLGNRLRWDAGAQPAYVVEAAPGRDGDAVSFELVDTFDRDTAKPLRMSVQAGTVRVSVPGLGAPGELRVRRSRAGAVRVNGRDARAVFDGVAGFYRIPLAAGTPVEVEISPVRQTVVTIVGDSFYINGRPTLKGKTWRGHRVDGLLPNSRMVQGVFDDLNPATRTRWAYPDTKTWDPARNTREFVAAMREWRRQGLLAFTLNLQGGSPEGYSKGQAWDNSAFETDGSLKADYLARLTLILDEADRLGMAVILGLFYFGQDERLRDETAVVRAVDESAAWVLKAGYRNVLVEISNECDGKTYDHEILKPARAAELIDRVKRLTVGGHRLLVSTSFEGNRVPTENVVRAADFVLLHGNGVTNPDRIVGMVAATRKTPGYSPKPIVFNEDDHYDFEKPWNNFVAATSAHASWGFFDFRRKDEGFDEGYQSVPVDWGISSPRKRGFFGLVAEMSR